MKLTLDLPAICHLEELAAAAWVPVAILEVNGWRLRHDAGVSRRANSVQALNYENGHLVEQIRQVEEAYQGWGLPSRFQLCPASQPPELDTVLESCGYVMEARTAVQIATAAEVLTAAMPMHRTEIEIRPVPTEQWWSVYSPSEGGGEFETSVRRAILERVRDETGYAVLVRKGVPVAVGLGVARGEWAGVFCVATSPEHRREGGATAIMAALAEWSVNQGAEQLYLQVMESNMAAMSLYARLGFRTVYHYHYRTAPGSINTYAT